MRGRGLEFVPIPNPHGLLLAVLFALLTWPSQVTGQAAQPQDFEELSRQANAERAHGNNDEAIRDYERALRIRPDWPEGWWYLGTLYADAGRFTDAIPVFRKLTEANPKLGPAWASLGLSEFETKNYQDSLIHLRQAQELGFQQAPYLDNAAIYHLALLLNLNGEFEDAFGLLASKFGKETLARQIQIAMAMSQLRIPLLPDQLDPGRDALIADAGKTAELLVIGSFDQAFQAFRQMLKDYPNTPFLHYAYGSALDFQSRYEEAEAQLRAEMNVMPHSALPYMRMAAIALKTHRPADAVPPVKRAIELAPGSATAHQILAKALMELGQSEQAAEETKAAEKLVPERPQVDSEVASFYARNPVPAGTVAVNTAADTTPTGSFDELARRAVEAAQAGRTGEATDYYQSALKLRPSWDEGWSALGTVYYIAGRRAESTSALKNSLAINPQRAEAWVFLGLCEFEGQEYRNAHLHLERGRELGFRGTPEAQQLASLRLAELRTWSGDFDGAKDLLIPDVDRNRLTTESKSVLGLSLLRAALLPDQVEPSREGLVRAAGETAALLYAERYNDAFQAFRQMLQNFPNTPFLHYAYGSALESVAQHDEAEVELREEIKAAPDGALPYMRLAAIFLKTGHPEDALSDAEIATKLDPQAPGAHELLGRSLLELGKTESAVKELEFAARLAPQYSEVHFNLARAYTKAHMQAEAERERTVFEELNAAEEREKTSQGDRQAFMTPYDRSTPATSQARTASGPKIEDGPK